MRNKFLLLHLIIFLALLSSCGDSVFLMPNNSKGESVTIYTVENGSFLNSGSSIPLELEYPEGDMLFDSVEIKLFSNESTLLARTVKELAEGEKKIPPVSFPELSVGMYILELNLYSGESVVKSQKRNFFYTEKDYDIQGITSYPPNIGLESMVLLTAQLNVPEETDPFLRWSMGSDLLKKGYLSEGLDSILWTAPEESGVYNIKVELFPVGPKSGESYTFPSARSVAAEIFVSNHQILPSDHMMPEESYYSLMHMNGSKEVLRNGKVVSYPVEEIGKPQLVPHNESFGFVFENGEGFRWNGNLLPISENVTSPFSFHINMETDTLEPDTAIVRSVDESGNGLTFGTNELGRMMAFFTNSTETVEINSGVEYPQSGLHEIVLSVVPRENSFLSVWYLDGIEISRSESDVSLPELPIQKTTTIGGVKGFSGFINELGVYNRDGELPSTDPEVYIRNVKKEYGDKLIHVNGFDGLGLPDGYTAGEHVEAQAGHVEIYLNGFLETPEFNLKQNRTYQVRLHFKNDNSEKAVKISAVAPDTGNVLFTFPIENLELSIGEDLNTNKQNEIYYEKINGKEESRLNNGTHAEGVYDADALKNIYSLQIDRTGDSTVVSSLSGDFTKEIPNFIGNMFFRIEHEIPDGESVEQETSAKEASPILLDSITVLQTIKN